jgi:3-hydroxyacyl-[acyl-carrier-protein] dehydratase
MLVSIGNASPPRPRAASSRPEPAISWHHPSKLTALASLTKEEIEAILPHRDPFLLLDEVVDLEPGERVVARKRVRPDEWYFAGHFPGRPIMPGVLIVEAMAQAGAVAVLSEEENRGKLALFAGIDGVRFKRVVEPGDELELTCELERVRGPIGRGKAKASVDGALAARGILTFAVEQ